MTVLWPGCTYEKTSNFGSKVKHESRGGIEWPLAVLGCVDHTHGHGLPRDVSFSQEKYTFSRLRLSHQGTQTKFCVLVCVRGRGENPHRPSFEFQFQPLQQREGCRGTGAGGHDRDALCGRRCSPPAHSHNSSRQ